MEKTNDQTKVPTPSCQKLGCQAYSLLPEIEQLETARADLAVGVDRLKRALNAAGVMGLIFYHVGKDHPGQTEHCQDLGCRLNRRSMEHRTGPLVWDDQRGG